MSLSGSKNITQSWCNWAFFRNLLRWQFITKHFSQNKVKFVIVPVSCYEHGVAPACLQGVVCCRHKLCKFCLRVLSEPLHVNHPPFFSDIMETRNLYSSFFSSLYPHTLRSTLVLTILLHWGISWFLIFLKLEHFCYYVEFGWKCRQRRVLNFNAKKLHFPVHLTIDWRNNKTILQIA